MPGFQVQTWEEVRANYLRAINNEKVLLQIVLSFIVLLAGFTIFATLSLTVIEKPRDIGLLKAVGATPAACCPVPAHRPLIGLIGGVLGLGLGLLVTDHVNSLKDALASIGIQIFPTDIYLFHAIPSASTAGLSPPSASAACTSPSSRASRRRVAAASLDPVDALRHE